MIKKALISGLVLLCLAVSLQAQKIGYTNVELLLAYMPETASISKQLEVYGATLEKSIKIKEDYYQMKLMEYQEKTQLGQFQPGEKEKIEAELGKLEQEIQAAIADAEDKLMKRQMELMKPLMDKIQNAINQVAAEGSFTYILNQTSGNNILFGLESLNVTEKLATKLGINLSATPGQ